MPPTHEPSDPARRFVTLAGGRAAYTEEGAGPPVVMVHGVPGSGRDFRWLAPLLRAERRVLRVDLPGFGETPSSTAAGFGVADQADFVLSLLAALEVTAALVVGHSMGGVVAAEMAVRAPERVAGLALVSSAGPRRHRGLRRVKARPLSRLLHSPLSRLLRRPLRTAFAAAGFSRHFGDEQLERTIHLIAEVDITEHAHNLRRLAQPTAVVWCADDPLVEDDIGEELAATVPAGPRHRFDDGGHNPQKAHAETIAESLLAFQDRLAARDAEPGLSAADDEPGLRRDPP